MSSNSTQDIQQLSPDKLMKGFSQTRFIYGLLLAVAVHIAIVGLTSMQFIWRTWIAQEEPEPEVVAEVADKPEEKPATEQAAATGAVERAETPPAQTNQRNAAQSEHEALMERYKDTPTVRAITEAADPDEIPDMPDGNNISIEDTNPSF